MGDGGGQKAHILSPLDFRLSSYLLAMFNFNYLLFNKLNMFNDLSKDRYLSYKERPLIRYIGKTEIKLINFIISDNEEIYPHFSFVNKAITLAKMPNYSKNKHLGKYWSDCFGSCQGYTL